MKLVQNIAKLVDSELKVPAFITGLGIKAKNGSLQLYTDLSTKLNAALEGETSTVQKGLEIANAIQTENDVENFMKADEITEATKYFSAKVLAESIKPKQEANISSKFDIVKSKVADAFSSIKSTCLDIANNAIDLVTNPLFFSKVAFYQTKSFVWENKYKLLAGAAAVATLAAGYHNRETVANGVKFVWSTEAAQAVSSFAAKYSAKGMEAGSSFAAKISEGVSNLVSRVR